MTTQKRWTRGFTPRDDAVHPCTAAGAWEWWYFDADFGNGYTVVGTFHLGSPRPPANPDVRFIEIAMYDPKGDRRMVRKRYPKQQCSFSEQTCDVVIGPNYMKGQIPEYEVHFHEGDLGCHLTYQSMVEGYIPEGEIVFGEPIDTSAYPPGTPPGWLVPVARAKVKGTLTWDGKTLDVSGEGYHDHNFGSSPLSPAAGHGYLHWGKLYIGDWTLNWACMGMVRKMNYGLTGRTIAYKKDKIVAAVVAGKSTGSDFTTELTGVEYPQTITVVYDEPGLIEGRMDIKVKKLIEFMDLHSRLKPFQRWYAETFIGRPAYFRYRIDYEANLKIVGEEVKSTGASWMEHHKMV